MAFTVSTTYDGSLAVLTCEGRIVLGGSSLDKDVNGVLEQGARQIVVDLAGVNYIDSSGIGQLVSAYTMTRNSGGDLVLAALQKKVRDLLTITKLITVFRVFDSKDEAVASCRQALQVKE